PTIGGRQSQAGGGDGGDGRAAGEGSAPGAGASRARAVVEPPPGAAARPLRATPVRELRPPVASGRPARSIRRRRATEGGAADPLRGRPLRTDRRGGRAEGAG